MNIMAIIKVVKVVMMVGSVVMGVKEISDIIKNKKV